MVGFDDGRETQRILDGQKFSRSTRTLPRSADVHRQRRLSENLDLPFMGDTKGGAFDVTEREALAMLLAAEIRTGNRTPMCLRPVG